MENKSVAVCKYFLETEVNNLTRDQKIKLLTKIAKTHKNSVFTSGEGSQIKLNMLPDQLIFTIHDMTRKFLNYT
jgi:hypothetical protein